MSKPKSDSNSQNPENPGVGFFLNNLWFFTVYFILLLLMASYGLIAEA